MNLYIDFGGSHFKYCFENEKVTNFVNWSNQMLELTQESRLFFVENFKSSSKKQSI